MSTIDDRLAELSITLPTPPTPLGNYVGAVTVGNLVFMSGHGTNKPDGSFVVGRVPVDCSQDEAYQAARLVGIYMLATLKEQIGDLDLVQRVVKVSPVEVGAGIPHDHFVPSPDLGAGEDGVNSGCTPEVENR